MTLLPLASALGIRIVETKRPGTFSGKSGSERQMLLPLAAAIHPLSGYDIIDQQQCCLLRACSSSATMQCTR